MSRWGAVIEQISRRDRRPGADGEPAAGRSGYCRRLWGTCTEDTGPLINEAKLTPTTVPSTGGTGEISFPVEDDCGIQQVYAEINTNEGHFVTFEMLPGETTTPTREVTAVHCDTGELPGSGGRLCGDDLG